MPTSRLDTSTPTVKPSSQASKRAPGTTSSTVTVTTHTSRGRELVATMSAAMLPATARTARRADEEP
jgi:hypothetical protein